MHLDGWKNDSVHDNNHSLSMTIISIPEDKPAKKTANSNHLAELKIAIPTFYLGANVQTVYSEVSHTLADRTDPPTNVHLQIADNGEAQWRTGSHHYTAIAKIVPAADWDE